MNDRNPKWTRVFLTSDSQAPEGAASRWPEELHRYRVELSIDEDDDLTFVTVVEARDGDAAAQRGAYRLRDLLRTGSEHFITHFHVEQVDVPVPAPRTEVDA